MSLKSFALFWTSVLTPVLIKSNTCWIVGIKRENMKFLLWSQEIAH